MYVCLCVCVYVKISIYIYIYICISVKLACAVEENQQNRCRELRLHPIEYLEYKTNPFDGEAPVTELWGIWSIPSLPLILGPL